MVDWKKISVGFLVLLISITAIYILLSEKIKLRIDDDKTTFYVKNENNQWIVSGREYNYLFDGSSEMNRRVSGIERNMIIDNISNTVTITRKTPYIRGPIVIDTYFFEGNIDDVELFPISHKVEIINGSGYFYRYEIRDLSYDGITYKLMGETELSFGLNMKVKLHPNYRWAWVYKTGLVKAQYDVATDYEVFNVRFFDPKKESIEKPYGFGKIGNDVYNVTKTKDERNNTIYKLEMPGITITTPIYTTCYWGKDPLRHCGQNINITLTDVKSSLAVNFFSKEFQTDRFKNFKVEQIGNIVRMSFDYPPNAGEEWNLTFDNGLVSFKIDPEISACSVLNGTGETYLLTADIIDSNTESCMDIVTDNIILDCQGHIIDANSTAETYGGITVYNSDDYIVINNITIQNCVLSDWGVFIGEGWGFYSFMMFGSKIINTSFLDNAIGIVLHESHNNTLFNLSVKNQLFSGIYMDSSNNTLFNSIISSNGFHFDFFCDSNSFYNNLFNNSQPYTCYLCTGSSIWNTTRQLGTRIYGNGTEMGGNYYISSGTSEITLQENDTEVLDDVWAEDGMDSSETWNNTFIQIGEHEEINLLYTFIKFNGENLPNDIINAELCMYSIVNQYDGGGFQVEAWGISNQTWRELYTDYDDMPEIISFVNSTQFDENTTMWVCINVTEWVKSERTIGHNNISFRLNSTDTPLAGEDSLWFHSKDCEKTDDNHDCIANPERKPKLIIIYSSYNYSEICTDSDKDGFCDSPLNITTMTPCTAGVDCGDNVDYLPYSDEYVGGEPNIDYGLNPGINFDFHCNPDTGTVDDEPDGQDSGTASIWCVNNGTVGGEFQVKLTESQASGWNISIANSSRGAMTNITTEWFTFRYNGTVGGNTTNCAWFWGTCSIGASIRPVSIDFQAV